MSYAIELTNSARDALLRLPPLVARHVVAELARLAEHPTQLSRPARLLDPPGQLFEIKLAAGGMDWHVDVIFTYSVDEQSLIVAHLAWETA